MTHTVQLKDPFCKTEAAIDAYQKEEKGILTLSFTENPQRKADPYAVIGRLQAYQAALLKAANDREMSKFVRILFEMSAYNSRANIESIDLSTEDLL